MLNVQNVQHVGPFSSLPNEIIQEIVRYSQTLDLASLSRTSKQIHLIATQGLYTNLILRTTKKGIRVFQTILKRPLAAASVRHLEIKTQCYRALRGFFELAARAIRQTTGIISLCIYPRMGPVLRSLRHHNARLPHLTKCRLPQSSEVPHFLRSHDTIEDLKLWPEAGVSENTLDWTPVILPHLKTFFGAGIFAPYLLPNSAITTLSLHCATGDDAITPLPLLPKSVREIQLLVITSWDERIVLATAKSLPYLAKLTLRHVGIHASKSELNTFLENIEGSLSLFRSLASISLVAYPGADFCQQSDLDEEFVTANRWGTRYPSLTCIGLPISGTRWLRTPHPNGLYFWPDPNHSTHDCRMRDPWVTNAILSGRMPCNRDMAKILQTRIEGWQHRRGV